MKKIESRKKRSPKSMLVKSAKVFEKLASFDLNRSKKGSGKDKLIKTEEELS